MEKQIPRNPNHQKMVLENKKKESTEEKPKKKKVKRTELVIAPLIASIPEKELNSLTDEEAKMVASDKLATETAEKKNAVESYVYNMRGKLQDSLSSFATEPDREVFMKLLNDTENWLYEDGADVTKSAYMKKLEELKALGDPIVKRHYEHENRYEALGVVQSVIGQLKLTASSMDPKYDHIEQDEKNKIVTECDTVEKYLRDQMTKQDTLPKHADPVVTVADITRRRKN